MYFFFFNDTATTEIYTLSLHDALPISAVRPGERREPDLASRFGTRRRYAPAKSAVVVVTNPTIHSGMGSRKYPSWEDRKSTRLNSSHANISYAVFCLKKKKKRISYKII